MGRAHATKTTKNTNVTEPITAQQETALLEINRNKSQVAKSFLECDLAHAAQQSVADIAAAQKTHYSHQRLRFFDMGGTPYGVGCGSDKTSRPGP